MKTKSNKILFGILILLLVSFTGIVSYALLNVSVAGNSSTTTLSIENEEIEVNVNGALSTSTSGIEPSDTTPFATQTYVVTNTGDNSFTYSLYWQELYNELQRYDSTSEDELYITATCTSYSNYGESNQAVSGTCTGFTKDIPTVTPKYTFTSGSTPSYYLSRYKTIASGITHVYSINVYYKNETYAQNYNQGKSFKGKIGLCSDELPIKSSLSLYTWEEIKELSDALVDNAISTADLSNTYNISIGNEKTATINGENHTFRIVGFSHDVDASGNTLGMTFEQVDLMNTSYAMKSSASSSDCWANSTLLTTINNFTIESELNSVITEAKKSYVTSVSDSTLSYIASKLWIMSETELSGTQSRTYGSAVEGTQYTYYLTNSTASDRIKKKGSSDYYYWLRSVYRYSSDGSSYFAHVNNVGTVNSRISNGGDGVSVCFCI